MAISLPAVVLAFSDALLASTLAVALSPSCRVAATPASWGELEDALDGCLPNVVVTDIVVGRDPVLAHLHQLIVACPETHFVVCTLHPDGVVVQRALLAGAAAVVGHDVSSAALGDALAALCREGRWPDGLGQAAVSRSARRAPLKPLSARLRQVNELLWAGKLGREVAEELKLGPSTVQRHVTEIRKAYAVPEGLPGPWEEARTARRGRKRKGEGN